VALIKLNGGLATTMGLQEPKSLVQARDGRSFLEIIIGQTLAMRSRYDVRLPLVLMNSEVTREATLSALASHPALAVDELSPDFLQSMIPKLEADSLAPVSWPRAPALEWCPPGHGDVYGALRRSGMLDALLERGFEYAMISNSDNLGAKLDPRVPAHLAANPDIFGHVGPDDGGGGAQRQGLEHRHGRADAEGAGDVARRRDHAALAAANDDRLVGKLRVIALFHGRVERVAIDMGERE